MKGWLFFIAMAGLAILSGCGTCSRSVNRSFVVGRDNFAFTNELLWTYEFGTSGAVTAHQAEPAPSYPHRCFPITRAAREFFYHAKFEPAEPKLEAGAYRLLVEEVVRRSSRCPSRGEDRVVIPGYSDLHSFSSDHPVLLREECGGPARSYFQRGNWRMVFPVSERRQRKTARKLVEKLRPGHLPIVHVYRFPDTALNHAILLCGAREAGGGVIFSAYDPNNPGRAAELKFDAESGAFLFERNQYFGGGPVRVYEVYRGLLY